VATTSDVVVFSRDELDLIVEFAGCSLDEKPGSNWVQDNGGLPEYICRIAKAVKKTGKTTSQAIAIAVSRVKKWAAGADGVDNDTKAKAAKALAEWEKLKGKSKAKDVKASRSQGEILCLSDAVTVFNVDSVRMAWDRQTNAWRTKHRQMYPAGGAEEPTGSYIQEMWTDHIIVKAFDDAGSLFRVDYTVDAEGDVTFQDPIPVRTQYVAIQSGAMIGDQMSNSELRQLMASVGPCYTSATDRVLLTISSKPTALSEVLSTSAPKSALAEVLSARAPRSALEKVLGL
jgi:hypothetical protein